MFETTIAGESSLLLRASFWQCFKAGVAFTCGAVIVLLTASWAYLFLVSKMLDIALRAR